MEKKMYLLLLEQKELDTQLNLENNYRDEAYEDFKAFRQAAYGYLEEGYISEKKFEKTYKKRIDYWEDIFEPSEDEDEEEENELGEEEDATVKKLKNISKL